MGLPASTTLTTQVPLARLIEGRHVSRGGCGPQDMLEPVVKRIAGVPGEPQVTVRLVDAIGRHPETGKLTRFIPFDATP